MKNKFSRGFLVGILTAFFISSIVLVVIVGGLNGKQEGLRVDQRLLEDEEKRLYYEQIVGKLFLMEDIIDTKFLDEVDSEALANGVYQGFMRSLGDPYSAYFTVEDYEALKESSSGIYYGIGATVSQNPSTGLITIVKPFVTGSAYENGILPGDIIYKVEDKEVTGVDLTDVTRRMKGPEGTEVNVSIVREGVTDPIELTLTRKKIEVPTIEYEMLEDDLGYIEIVQFDEVTIEQFSDAIDDLESKGAKGLVIDVRNNPGGLLGSVVAMIDRIIDKGLVVYTEDKDGNREEDAAFDKNEYNKPIVILINENSASASEIFAGTLQDYDKAIVVGETSFGKGIVQQVVPISDGTAVKLTISKYYTPKGRNIHGEGITPDVKVELSEELKKEIVIPKDKDNQLKKAIEVLEKEINK